MKKTVLVRSCQTVNNLPEIDSEEPFIVISVRGKTFEQWPEITERPNLKGVLRLVFDDILKSDMGLSGLEMDRLVTTKHTDEIANFLFKHSDVHTIVCQCFAGISRSSAIAMAILDVFNGDSQEIWDNGKFNPNQRVWRLLLKSLGHSITRETKG